MGKVSRMSAMRGIVLLPERKKKTDYLPHSSDQNKATSIILLRHAFAQLHAPAACPCMHVQATSDKHFQAFVQACKSCRSQACRRTFIQNCKKVNCTVATEWVLIDLGTLACCIR